MLFKKKVLFSTYLTFLNNIVSKFRLKFFDMKQPFLLIYIIHVSFIKNNLIFFYYTRMTVSLINLKDAFLFVHNIFENIDKITKY